MLETGSAETSPKSFNIEIAGARGATVDHGAAKIIDSGPTNLRLKDLKIQKSLQRKKTVHCVSPFHEASKIVITVSHFFFILQGSLHLGQAHTIEATRVQLNLNHWARVIP